MAGNKKARGATARARARQQRAELEASRAEQQRRIDDHQVAYFEAEDRAKAARDELADAQKRVDALLEEADAAKRDAAGALLEDEKQSLEDVGVLLGGIDHTELRRLRTEYKQARRDDRDDQERAPDAAKAPKTGAPDTVGGRDDGGTPDDQAVA